MRLNTFTDYALRVLIYTGARHPELTMIQEIASGYEVSTTHLTKVVNRLGRGGFLETVRGRHGGIRLGRPAGEIKLGAVVRHCEHDLRIVECFSPSSGNCRIEPGCTLKPILSEALEAFLQVLDKYSLEDLLRHRAMITALLDIEPAPAAP